MTVIRDCTYLVRVDEGYRLAYGDIVIRDKIIAEITKPNAAPVTGQPVMLGTGCLVVPGFVNAHTHSPLNVLRGTVDGMDHVGFMWTNQADTAGRSEDEVYASALLGCLDMIRSGITAAIDHYPEQNCTAGAVDPVDPPGDRESTGGGIENHSALADRFLGVGDLPAVRNGRDVPAGKGGEAVVELGHLHVDCFGTMWAVSPPCPPPGRRWRFR